MLIHLTTCRAPNWAWDSIPRILRRGPAAELLTQAFLPKYISRAHRTLPHLQIDCERKPETRVSPVPKGQGGGKRGRREREGDTEILLPAKDVSTFYASKSYLRVGRNLICSLKEIVKKLAARTHPSQGLRPSCRPS